MTLTAPARPDYRFEVKYLLDPARLQTFQQAVRQWVVPDEHHGKHQSYRSYSVYFDSPQLVCFQEKLEGFADRFKVRLRRYQPDPGGPTTAWFLEIKWKHEQVIAKDRVQVSEALVRRLLGGQVFEDVLGREGLPVGSQVSYLIARHHLQPTLTVLYTRSAYRGVFDRDLRITYDRALQCSFSAGLDASTAARYLVLPPTLTCLELKFRASLPRWMTRLIQALQLQPLTLSKYALSVERCFGEERWVRRLIHQELDWDARIRRWEEHARSPRPTTSWAPITPRSAASV